LNLVANGEIPSFHARRLGADRWSLKHGDDVVSWGELDERSTRRAWRLKAEGVGKGDLVTLSVPNSSAFYELTFALWKLGAIPHVVSWRLPRIELNAILEVARPKLVIASSPELCTAVGAKGDDFGLVDGSGEPMVYEAAPYWKAMSSGGSTGRPKIIVDHTPGAVDVESPLFRLPVDGVILNPGPLYHNAPFVLTHHALFRGSSVVGMSKFDAEQALRLIDENKVAWVNMVPTMMLRIWRLPSEVRSRYDLSSLSTVWHMAAPMPAWLKEAWIKWIGPERIWELYGGTERQGSTVITGQQWLEHRGSVGRPTGCEMRILDEEGRDAPAGEIGEIYFMPSTGAGSTYHYLGAEARQTSDGWESLGDFGWMDADGFLYIADRRTDMILSGGANIYPAEVESALMEHPGVDVAVVIGLPHEDLGASVHAIVRPTVAWGTRLSAEDLLTHLGERLVRYKVPRTIEFTTDPLRDDAGKVRRSALRDERIGRVPAVTINPTGIRA